MYICVSLTRKTNNSDIIIWQEFVEINNFQVRKKANSDSAQYLTA